MKIALIDPSLFTWPYDKALAEGLEKNGHKILVFGKYLAEGEAGKNSPLLQELFYPALQKPWMQKLPRGIFLALKGLMHPFSLMRLLRALRQFQPDVIHFQWTPLPVIDRFFISSFRKIAPVILTVHDSTPFNDNPGSRLQRLSAVAVMHEFDRLIVHTEQARNRLIAYGLPSERIAVIPHGILDVKMDPALSEPAAVSARPVTMLLFGKLKPYKGADILIRALAAIPSASLARCQVRIVGKPYMDVTPLTELAKKLGVQNNILWDLRFIEDDETGRLFAESDIVVMPYRAIDASGVLMIALLAGRPIVASRIGLFSEILQDGVHGYLTPPEDHLALASALAALVDDGQRRLQMGKCARALGTSIPGWEEIAKSTVKLYREAMDARAGFA